MPVPFLLSNLSYFAPFLKFGATPHFVAFFEKSYIHSDGATSRAHKCLNSVVMVLKLEKMAKCNASAL